MRTLEEQMSTYAAYHQDARNKATHYIGVPMIVFSLMIALGWMRADLFGIPWNAAVAVTVALVAYYLLLDMTLGVAMAAILAALLWAAEPLARAPFGESVTWFLAFFVGGWALQLLGHVFEGRKPALVDNLFQIFVAPIFLAAEAFFALGWKPALRAAVQRRALEQRAAAGAAARAVPG